MALVKPLFYAAKIGHTGISYSIPFVKTYSHPGLNHEGGESEMRKQKEELLLRHFRGMTDEDQDRHIITAEWQAKKNPRKNVGLRLIHGGLASVKIANTN